MPPGNEDNHDDDEGDNSEEMWNNEWDDNESITGGEGEGRGVEGGQLERQQILQDQDEEEMEEEIRANMNSRIISSLHNYKIAGFALIITLISFTINTVRSLPLQLLLTPL